MKRADSVLLAGIGVLIVHQFAYTVSAVFGVTSSVAHGHLAFAWFAGSLGLLLTLARSVTTSLKRRHHNAGTVGSVARAISLGYLLMESAERQLDGYGIFELFSEPVFWLGLAIAPLVAIALHWSVKTVVEAAVAFLSPSTPTWPPAPASVRLAALPVGHPRPAVLLSALSERGPPVDRYI